MSLYQLDNIQHCYNGCPVLNIPQWQIPADTVVGLAGPNGSGKSTLLHLLGFVERPSQGKIYFEGRKADIYTGGLRTKVVLLPQHSYLLKRSVFNNIAYGLRLRNDRRDESDRVHEALRWVGLDPGLFAQRPWFALSGGEARRVALAARLVLQPRVFLLDEPTTSVDAASAHMIKESILRARRQWNTTLVISSHDTEWLNEICDHMLYLFRGQIMEGGQPTIIFGPWEINSDGNPYKILASGEHLIAAHPPERSAPGEAVPEEEATIDPLQAVAAIDAGQMMLQVEKDRIPAGFWHLKGKLMRLTLEKTTGHISATVNVESLTFHISLRPADAMALRLFPGQTVWIGYDPAAVKWMND